MALKELRLSEMFGFILAIKFLFSLFLVIGTLLSLVIPPTKPATIPIFSNVAMLILLWVVNINSISKICFIFALIEFGWSGNVTSFGGAALFVGAITLAIEMREIYKDIKEHARSKIAPEGKKSTIKLQKKEIRKEIKKEQKKEKFKEIRREAEQKLEVKTPSALEKEQIKRNIIFCEEEAAYKQTKEQKIENDDEVISFYRKVENQERVCPPDAETGLYLDDSNFNLFYDFISNTKEKLDITTNVFSHKTLINLFKFVINKPIVVRIITNREKDKKYNIKNFIKNKKIRLEIFCSKPTNHSKIIIRDGEKMLIGSSNLDDSSLNSFYEVNTVVQNKDDMAEAKSVFDSLFLRKDMRNRALGRFLYTGFEAENLPVCIEELARKEDREILILMALGQINIKILKRIKNCNPAIPIKLIVSRRWPKGESNPIDKETAEEIWKNWKGKTKEIKIIPKNANIHAKLYIFKGQKKAVISSLNLTEDSWERRLFETGQVIEGQEAIEQILSEINALEDSDLEEPGNMIFTYKKPVTPDYEKVISKDYLTIPWLPAIKIPKRQKNKQYFYIPKKEETKSEEKEQYLRSNKTSPTKIPQKYEGKVFPHTTYTSYPALTMGKIRGKPFNKIKDLKANKRSLEIKLRKVIDKDEQKELEKALAWTNEQLKKQGIEI